MRAVRAVDGAPTVLDVEMAESPSGWAVVDVVANGLCGSDHHLLGMGVTVTLGHEIAGRLPDGTPVAIQPIDYCGSCAACLDGRAELCAGLFGPLGVAVDGGLADRVAVPVACLVPLEADVSPAIGCLAEPVAVAVHAVNRAVDLDAGRVLVVGGGAIGLAAVVAAQQTGADVDLAARHPHQIAAGERLGAGSAPRRDYDVVIEAAGSGSALGEAIERCRPGGTVSIPGFYWEPITVQAPASWLTKQIDLMPSMLYGHHHGRREIDVAAELLASRPDLADAIVTHRFELDDAPEAFAVSADRAAGAIKVVVEPGRH
ncbi:MAG: alcohol dehydrogenase catalytic domain-containing protein [Acidimicrobiia bacterium]|nr:alcohol dehydrogenase catalytic domain-containing protein [Acidimicrobiia bacterium]